MSLLKIFIVCLSWYRCFPGAKNPMLRIQDRLSPCPQGPYISVGKAENKMQTSEKISSTENNKKNYHTFREGDQVTNLAKVVRESLCGKMVFDLRLERWERGSHVNIWEKSHPSTSLSLYIYQSVYI